jgi:hypothetical protein
VAGSPQGQPKPGDSERRFRRGPAISRNLLPTETPHVRRALSPMPPAPPAGGIALRAHGCSASRDPASDPHRTLGGPRPRSDAAPTPPSSPSNSSDCGSTTGVGAVHPAVGSLFPTNLPGSCVPAATCTPELTVALIRDSLGLTRPAGVAMSAARPLSSARPEISARGDVELTRDGVHPWIAAGRPWPDAARGTRPETFSRDRNPGSSGARTSRCQPRPAPPHSAAPGKRRQPRLRTPGQGSSLRRTDGS